MSVSEESKSCSVVKMTSEGGQVFSLPLDSTTPASLAKRLATLNPALEHPSFDIKFEDLTYSVPDRKRGSKRLLSGLNGTFRSHELTAIMGPSGAGKSTLLNVIAGYKTSRGMTGTVMLNGVDRTLLRGYRKAICYIMQEDQLTPHLSVSEVMHIAANLKLGVHCSNKSKAIVVDEILETLGLGECRDTRSKNLSGGQRKRLSIALELVNNPPIMFLDEPTSGLDSASCFQCVSLLQSLARGGRTIVCSIHQPSARLYEMLDRLYVLAEGQCLYQGDVPSLLPFLNSVGLQCPNFHNPADYVIEVAVGEHGDVVPRVVNALKEAQAKRSAKADPDKGKESLAPSKVEQTLDSFRYPSSCLSQYWILSKRTLLCTYRDLSLFWVRFWAHLVNGLLFGMLYYQIGNDATKVINNSGCIFFTLLFLMFAGLMPTITTFPMERNVFIKEYINHWYSLSSFYLAKTIADLPFQIMFSTMYISVIYYMSGQPPDMWRFLIVLAICCMISMIAQSLGILIGIALDVEVGKFASTLNIYGLFLGSFLTFIHRRWRWLHTLWHRGLLLTSICLNRRQDNYVLLKGVFLGPVLNVPLLLFSGFFMGVDTLPWGMHWLADISYIRYGYEASMNAIYGFNRSDLDCPNTNCHYLQPSLVLEEMKMEHSDIFFDCAFLFGFFFILRLLGIIMLKWNIYRDT